jgi:hypothetical protein
MANAAADPTTLPKSSVAMGPLRTRLLLPARMLLTAAASPGMLLQLLPGAPTPASLQAAATSIQKPITTANFDFDEFSFDLLPGAPTPDSVQAATTTIPKAMTSVAVLDLVRQYLTNCRQQWLQKKTVTIAHQQSAQLMQTSEWITVCCGQCYMCTILPHKESTNHSMRCRHK